VAADQALVGWLLAGDPAVRWRALRDLTDATPQEVADARAEVATQGWGAALLSRQSPDGGWGGGVYAPKFTSTTYTLLDLAFLGLPPGHPAALRGCERLVDWRAGWGRRYRVDTCFFGLLSRILVAHGWSGPEPGELVAGLLERQLADGGWNCRADADLEPGKHSSFHTTILALEGLAAYAAAGGGIDTAAAQGRGREFFLAHRLYQSHRTGAVALKTSLRFPAFPQWRFDVLRGLEYFADAGTAPDERLSDAVAVVRSARRRDGRWPTYAAQPGRSWFELEPRGASRYNTARVLSVLRWWESGAAGPPQPPGDRSSQASKASNP
jgi:hypothetical protein